MKTTNTNPSKSNATTNHLHDHSVLRIIHQHVRTILKLAGYLDAADRHGQNYVPDLRIELNNVGDGKQYTLALEVLLSFKDYLPNLERIDFMIEEILSLRSL